jgi:antitoxin (DNA-binding transcriptional repressor) of toxin-antitoxin stability system
MVTKTIDISTIPAIKDVLLPLLEADTELILMDGDKPIAKVTPLAQPAHQNRESLAGIFRGMMTMSDDFDDPLPDEFWLGKE